MESARPAAEEDLERIAELASEAIVHLSAEKGGAVWRRREARREPVMPGLRAALADPAQVLVAGRIDEVIVGYGSARTEPLADGGLLGIVTDVYVEPAARGVAVGEAVMDELLAWCRAQGCFGVDSLALPGDRETKNFFERYGLVARAIVVHRRLEDDE